MKKIYLPILLGLIGQTLEAGTLIGSSSFVIAGRDSAQIVINANSVSTSKVSLSIDCRAGIDSVSAVTTDGQEERLSGSQPYFSTPDGKPVEISQLKVSVTSRLILAMRTQNCTLQAESMDIPSGPVPPAGQINFVSINNDNSQVIGTCVGNALQQAFQARNMSEVVNRVSGPSMSSADGRTIYFLAETTTNSYGIGLNAIGINNGWRYASSGGSIGPVGFRQWAYTTNTMSSVADLVQVSGSVIMPKFSAPIMSFDIAPCWRN